MPLSAVPGGPKAGNEPNSPLERLSECFQILALRDFLEREFHATIGATSETVDEPFLLSSHYC